MGGHVRFLLHSRNSHACCETRGNLVMLGGVRSTAESTSSVETILEAFTAPSYLPGQWLHQRCNCGFPVNTGRRWVVCHGQSAAVGDLLLHPPAEPHMYGVGIHVIFEGLASM
jgi:hypothetical protein